MKAIVIADDFTGAAEVAGISLQYGFSSEIYFDTKFQCNNNVTIVCTDSRSKKLSTALAVVQSVVENIRHHKVDFLYKKTDSALRGHIVEELLLQMKIMQQQTALLVPANPSLGRTIINGTYFINGKPISETAFAKDPEFPITASNLKKIFKNKISIAQCIESNLPTGIIIGETKDRADVDCWATKTADNILLAGAGDFFGALLKKQYRLQTIKPPVIQLPHLYVCGTAYKNRVASIKELSKKNEVVCYLSSTDLQVVNKKNVAERIIPIIKKQNKLILAVGDVPNMSAEEIRQQMAKIVFEVLKLFPVAELFIEGGSTAAAILQNMKIKSMEAVGLFMRGVVQLKYNNLIITVKPGSYELPPVIKELHNLF
ncbi:MAG: four-carbon acid sugar kinase family protein [Niabella sp.]